MERERDGKRITLSDRSTTNEIIIIGAIAENPIAEQRSRINFDATSLKQTDELDKYMEEVKFFGESNGWVEGYHRSFVVDHLPKNRFLPYNYFDSKHRLVGYHSTTYGQQSRQQHCMLEWNWILEFCFAINK